MHIFFFVQNIIISDIENDPIITRLILYYDECC